MGRRLIAAETRQSLIVIAPTQTSKTTGLAIPALLEWDGPVLATSVKTDLVRDTLAHRRQLGDVKIYDPTGVTGLPAAGWTPLSGCTNWTGARRTAERLARAAQPARASNESEFWAKSGARFLAPLLFAAACNGKSMRDVVRWIDTDAQERVADLLDGTVYDAPSPASDDGVAAALAAVQAVWQADDRLRSSLYMTASVALDAYNDPTIADSAASAELTSAWLLNGRRNAAFLCATADEQQRLRPLFVTLLEEVVAEVTARAAATGAPLDPPLLIVLDEAANIAPLPHLDALASTGAGQGIQLVTVVQDLAQMHRQWPGAAETIVNNHRAKLIGSGISCPTTIQYVGRLLGEQEERQLSTSIGSDGRRSRTDAPAWRPLAPANALRQSRAGDAVLIYGNLPPAWTKLRPWFRDRALRRLARG
ncbi:MAG TPA: type IV secretory system conjugative DNA transfer family protein [Solirubrobacteraceae bacterium]